MTEAIFKYNNAGLRPCKANKDWQDINCFFEQPQTSGSM